MQPSIDSYGISAKYYDGAYASMQNLADVSFYVELAKELGGPVLEIGCGTGRVLIPTASAGIEIHGLDNSAPMKEILSAKVGRLEPSGRERITLHSGDMRDFDLNRKFRLVTIPFRPMQHMYTVADQIRALTCARAHVADGGVLAFDVFYPKFERLPLGIGEEMLEAEWAPASEPGTMIRRWYRKDSLDKVNQILTLRFIFRIYREDRVVLEESETLKMSYYTYPHLHALFKMVGLEPVAEYGSFAKTPLDNSAAEMIFLLRRA